MNKLGRLTLAFKKSTEIGQQQNNMKRFYKEATVGPNPNPKHPLHQYTLIHLDIFYFLMAKPLKHPIKTLWPSPHKK